MHEGASKKKIRDFDLTINIVNETRHTAHKTIASGAEHIERICVVRHQHVTIQNVEELNSASVAITQHMFLKANVARVNGSSYPRRVSSKITLSSQFCEKLMALKHGLIFVCTFHQNVGL
jgi:hypothetical protein